MALTSPAANPLSIALSSLAAGRRGITPAYGASLGEAAAVCIADARHPNPAPLKVDGFSEVDAHLGWDAPSQQALDTWNDEEFATEQGAYGIAALLVEEFGLEVVQRSRKGTGFDYWLGAREEESNLFQGLTRLEVSGIRVGDEAKIAQRTRIKLNQTKKSDDLALPAVVAIIEFSNPIARISERCPT